MIDFATYYSCIDFVHFWPKILSSSLYNTILYIVFRASALFVKRCIIKKIAHIASHSHQRACGTQACVARPLVRE